MENQIEQLNEMASLEYEKFSMSRLVLSIDYYVNVNLSA